MARTVVEIQNEYGQAAASLGQEVYIQSLAEDQLEKHAYNIRKLKDKMQTLAKEAQKLNEEAKQEVVPEVKEPANEPA